MEQELQTQKRKSEEFLVQSHLTRASSGLWQVTMIDAEAPWHVRSVHIILNVSGESPIKFP
jgi:hypothetical protein